MPKIKAKQSFASVEHSFHPGEEKEVSKELAEEWVRIGYAEYVEEKPTRRTTKKKAGE